jgi:hypothetical protein
MNAISKKKKPINRKKYRPNLCIIKGYLSYRITLKRLAHSRPVTGFTGNIGIAPIAIHATSTNRILFEIKNFGVWHPVKDFAKCADLLADRAHQKFDETPAPFYGHE